ncbi:hypothetical protein CgunFtcFv8_010709 [Champsocephalus gunnari]|uniref:Uncharacterized protein n=1 Tax=Champsocephalus gunnari TaxID=52237 RepID=A0AAN8HVR0_CHAGU|nr:hypothetical protein CgunFtcFv8_010709 [Champsocephalus gunnari]
MWQRTSKQTPRREPPGKLPANPAKTALIEVERRQQNGGGDTKEQHELDRHQLIAESKKKDSTAIKDLMCGTFAHGRQDVISLQMSIEDIKDRWPVLFDVSQVSAEFQRITILNLEPKFMSMLDFYSPKLLSMFQGEKGAVGERHRAKMSILLQSGIPIQRK